MDVPSTLPGWALAPAAAAIPLILLSRRRPAVRETWSVLAAAAQTGLVGLMLPATLGGYAPTWQPLPLVPRVPLLLRADALGVLFALVSSALWVLTTVYSIGYTRALAEPAQTRYFAAFALCLLATLGVALAGNLLTFFLFYEVLTVAAYPLVVHHGTADAARAGRIYLAYLPPAGAALLAAVTGTAALAGEVEFRPGGILDPESADRGALWALFLLFLLGLGVKAAVVPLHSWLPVAMIAPTPVSALLHAVAVVKAGVFGVVRVTGFVFGPQLLADLGAAAALQGLAGATILIGSLAAFGQDNLKRLLAFSTVSQLSYVLLGAAVGTPQALAGGVYHMVSHAVLKIALFFCAGAVYATTHRERISELGGVGRRMPLTMGAFTAAAFMLAGLPPGVAFVSKWRLLDGSAAAGAWGAFGILLASALLNIAYFAPVVVRAFGGPADGPRGEARLTLLLPLLAATGAGLALGVAPDAGVRLLSLAVMAARAVTGAP